MRDDEKQTPGNKPVAEVKAPDVGKVRRRVVPLLTRSEYLENVRDSLGALIGLATICLAGLMALALWLDPVLAGWGDGGSSGPGRDYWVVPTAVLLLLLPIFASLFLRRVLAFMHVTAIVVAIAMIAAFVASRRNAETARLYLGMIIYLLAWCIFYVLALLAKREKSSTGRWMPRELGLLQKLPRGLTQEEVRQRLGEPMEAFQRSSGETFWRYGHGPREKWVFAIFGPDQRYKRFELD